MRVRLRLFALARETVQADVLEIELSATPTVGELRRGLAEAHPALARLLPHVLFAVDSQYARDDTPIEPGSEVACIPPVSGG